MRTAVTLDDALHQQALDAADPEMDKADVFREAVKTFVRVQAAKRLAALGGKAPGARHSAPPGERAAVKPVVVDTSVGVGHFLRHNPALADLLAMDLVHVHPMVLGQIACGSPPSRTQTLADLARLPSTQQASLQEVLTFIERAQLFGLGCGFVDITLLASTLLTPGAELWTLDKRLAALAERAGVLYRPALH